MKVLIYLILLVMGVGLSVMSWYFLLSGNDGYYKRPLFGILLGIAIVLWSVKELILIAINPLIKDSYPRLYVRLNGDIWTFLFGPIKDEK